MIRNGFTHVDDTTNPLLSANPNTDIPVAEIQFANSFEGPQFIGPVSVVNETLADKDLSCRFSPGRYLEQVIVELKENDPLVPMNDSSLKIDDNPVIKNVHKGKKPRSMDLSFRNKNDGHLISIKLRN
jgi:hypothetical protein